jgi:hypothetical protein
MFRLKPNLAKYFYGSSALSLHHKIDPKKIGSGVWILKPPQAEKKQGGWGVGKVSWPNTNKVIRKESRRQRWKKQGSPAFVVSSCLANAIANSKLNMWPWWVHEWVSDDCSWNNCCWWDEFTVKSSKLKNCQLTIVLMIYHVFRWTIEHGYHNWWTLCVCVCVCVYVGGSWLQMKGEDGCEQGNGAMEVCSTEQVH